MAERDPYRDIDYERLNLLGKTVFLTGAAVHYTTRMIDRVLEHTAGVVAETEKAFRQGLDPNIDEAKVLEETERRDGDTAG